MVFASSLGTIFEWYDFYLYATLAPFFASLFFPHGNDTAALLSALATYAAGFLIRPFGAVVFGRIGDRLGRKYAFLITIVIMGISTFAVGLLPTYRLYRLAGAADAGRCCASPRALRSAANMAARRPMSPSTRRSPARLGDELDPDHRDDRLFHVAADHRALPQHHVGRGVHGLGLAAAVPAFDPAADFLRLYPPAPQRIAALPAHEGSRPDLAGADLGELLQAGECAEGAVRAVSARRPGRAWSGIPASSMRCSSCRSR